MLVIVASAGLVLSLDMAPAGAAGLTRTSTAIDAGGRIATFVSMSPVSAARSTVVASPTSLPTGPLGTTVTVTLLSSTGAPVPGKQVTLTTTGGHASVTTTSDPTNSDGQASFTVTDTKVEMVTLVARDTTDGITITCHLCVYFVNDPPADAPEAPVTIALPVLAAGLLGGTTLVSRRRRSVKKG
jgi:Bacterial Ig-like domain (group 1)